jgi:hypothetical protein
MNMGFRGMGKSTAMSRLAGKPRKRKDRCALLAHRPTAHRREFSPAIPRRVAPQQSPLPLRRSFNRLRATANWRNMPPFGVSKSVSYVSEQVSAMSPVRTSPAGHDNRKGGNRGAGARARKSVVAKSIGRLIKTVKRKNACEGNYFCTRTVSRHKSVQSAPVRGTFRDRSSCQEQKARTGGPGGEASYAKRFGEVSPVSA